jgi:hypothetical protein
MIEHEIYRHVCVYQSKHVMARAADRAAEATAFALMRDMMLATLYGEFVSDMSLGHYRE